MYLDHIPSLRISSVLFGHTISVVVPHHLISYLVQPILNTESLTIGLINVQIGFKLNIKALWLSKYFMNMEIIK